MPGVHVLDLHERRGQEALDLGGGSHEPGPLRIGEGLEERPGQRVAALVEDGPLGAACLREASRADAAVVVARTDGDEPGRLQ